MTLNRSNTLSLWHTITDARGPTAIVLVRLVVGIVFTSEGILKFVRPAAQGAGRFAKIGIPWPDIMGPLIGGVELLCGLLVLVGFLTRVAAAPLIADMVVAILSTKVPILLGHGYWLFAHSFAPKAGVWDFLHESRTDLAMLLSSIFLLIVGAGQWSIDAVFARSQPPRIDPSRGAL
jgi:putative oxidoreductase